MDRRLRGTAREDFLSLKFVRRDRGAESPLGRGALGPSVGTEWPGTESYARLRSFALEQLLLTSDDTASVLVRHHVNAFLSDVISGNVGSFECCLNDADLDDPR